MPSVYDSMFEGLLQTDLDVRTAEKQSRLSALSSEKKSAFDPNYSVYNPDAYDTLDADTIRHKRTGEIIRFSGPEGVSPDAFETDVSRYDLNPGRAIAHRKAYARLFGRDFRIYPMKIW